MSRERTDAELLQDDRRGAHAFGKPYAGMLPLFTTGTHDASRGPPPTWRRSVRSGLARQAAVP